MWPNQAKYGLWLEKTTFFSHYGEFQTEIGKMDDQMEFEEPLPEEAPTILDPGTLGNTTLRMTESQIQVGNMGEKYKVSFKKTDFQINIIFRREKKTLKS